MTRQDLRNRILRALNDDVTSPVFWSTGEVDMLLDEGQEVLAEEVEALKRTVHVPRRPGTMVYTLRGLGPRIMTPYRIWSPERELRLVALTMHTLDTEHRRWLEVAGQPEWWFPVSWDAFGVWPVPVEGGGLHRVDCFVWPDALLDDGDEPEFPEPDQDALVTYGQLEGHLKQMDVLRAIDQYSQFTARWRDRKARHGARLLQHRVWGRDAASGGDDRAPA